MKCLLNPKILAIVHHSQNRIESYHSLRAAVAKVGGKKALIGRTDLEVEISNLCGRLIAGAIIYYNASLHSHILDKDRDNKKLLQFIKKNSPVSWDHICFTGYFSFYGKKKPIDLDEIIGKINFEDYK